MKTFSNMKIILKRKETLSAWINWQILYLKQTKNLFKEKILKQLIKWKER